MMTEPRLYIIMREDIADMNPGKAMAQAAHAQAEFDEYCDSEFSINDSFAHEYTQWRDGRAFGTTVVLRAELHKLKELARVIGHSGLVFDPTYPYRNWYGKLFTAEEITCAWAFVYSEQDIEFMQQFALHE